MYICQSSQKDGFSTDDIDCKSDFAGKPVVTKNFGFAAKEKF